MNDLDDWMVGHPMLNTTAYDSITLQEGDGSLVQIVFDQLGPEKLVMKKRPTAITLHTDTCDNNECDRSSLDTKLLVCSRCNTTWYCSPECQRKRWPIHSKVCREGLYVDVSGSVEKMMERQVQNWYPYLPLDGMAPGFWVMKLNGKMTPAYISQENQDGMSLLTPIADEWVHDGIPVIMFVSDNGKRYFTNLSLKIAPISK